MMRMIALFGLAASVACGGGGGGGGNSAFSGTVRGQTMSANSQISGNVSFVGGSAALVVISDAGALCNSLTANSMPKNAKGLSLVVADFDGTTTTAPAGTGVFTVTSVGSMPPAHAAFVQFSTLDASCKPISTQSGDGASGTVTLTKNSNGVYAGKFDVTFDSGDHITGTFDAAGCTGMSGSSNQNNHTCSG